MAKRTSRHKPIVYPLLRDDDPIYSEGWRINTVPAWASSPTAARRDAPSPAPQPATGTGLDYRENWIEEIRTIHNEGPFSVAEIKALTFDQGVDYYYVTSWFLRQEGREAFVAAREWMREMFLERMAQGLRLRPDVE